MKKLALIISILLVCTSLFACTDKANTFEYSLTDIQSAAEGLDFGDAEFYPSTDEFAAELLMYSYGIMDEAVLKQIDSYLLTSPGTNSSKTLAVIIFKEGTNTETFDAVEKTVKEYYFADLGENAALYDPSQAEIAEKATFMRWDNAMAIVAFDNAGNTAATDVLFK